MLADVERASAACTSLCVLGCLAHDLTGCDALCSQDVPMDLCVSDKKEDGYSRREVRATSR